jgi:hypothetical protein
VSVVLMSAVEMLRQRGERLRLHTLESP